MTDVAASYSSQLTRRAKQSHHISEGTADDRPTRKKDREDSALKRKLRGKEMEKEEGSEKIQTSVEMSAKSAIFKLPRIPDLDAHFGGSFDDLYEDYEAENKHKRALIAVNYGPTDESPSHNTTASPKYGHVRIEEAKSSETNLEGSNVTSNGIKITNGIFSRMYDEEKIHDKELDARPKPGSEDEEVGSQIISGEDEVHHYNFLDEPIACRSFTPPETSLWAAYSGNKDKQYDPFSRRGVLVAQAGKMLDPFSYLGPVNILYDFEGSELEDRVKPFVRKTYAPFGAWMNDKCLGHELAPLRMDEEQWSTFYCSILYEPPETHRVDPVEDRHDIIINDSLPHYFPNCDFGYARRTWIKPRPSRLAIVQGIDTESGLGESEEPQRPDLSAQDAALDEAHDSEAPSVQIPISQEQSKEEIDAEDTETYSQSPSASSLSVSISTDYTSPPPSPSSNTLRYIDQVCSDEDDHETTNGLRATMLAPLTSNSSKHKAILEEESDTKIEGDNELTPRLRAERVIGMTLDIGTQKGISAPNLHEEESEKEEILPPTPPTPPTPPKPCLRATHSIGRRYWSQAPRSRPTVIPQTVFNDEIFEVHPKDHCFDNNECVSDIPNAKMSFAEYFYGSFFIAVGERARRIGKRWQI